LFFLSLFLLFVVSVVPVSLVPDVLPVVPDVEHEVQPFLSRSLVPELPLCPDWPEVPLCP
jgi:hypothetical protein